MTSITMTRPDATEYAPYYGKYISFVPEGDVVATLSSQLANTLSFLGALTEEQAASRYAPDKWSIKEVVGHMLDTERIFGHRAFRFARNDQAALPGYEQDDYVLAGGFNNRSLSDLIEEFELVRLANLCLLRSLDEAAWHRRGIANDNEVSVRALAYILAGHETHHLNIIRERYL